MSKQITEQQFSKTYDVVVIGAGNGGLTAAVKLAKSGIKVLLLEQHNLPGGFATSFVRGRFEFEASLHELCDFGPSSNKGGIRILFEDKIGLDTEFIRVPEAYRLILTDPENKLDVTMPFGLDEFIEVMEKEIPGCRESVDNFFSLAKDILDAFEYIGKMKGKPDQGVLMKEHPNFLRTGAYTVDEVQDALKMPEKARKILNAYWCYLGLPTSRVNFTIFASMVYLYITRGAYIPKYRSHEYTSELDAKIREFGGKIEYNTRVDKILVENSNVIGVETSSGDKIKTNLVISNASPTLVYNKLVYPKSEVPEIAYKEVNARIHGLSAMTIFLGLDATAEELGLTDYSYFIMNDMDSDGVYESWSKLQAPTGQATVVLNKAIPDCSPPGTCIIFITTLFKPEAWKDVKPEEYFEVKNKIAEGLIKDFEKATGAPIKEHIEEIEVASPETYAHYTGTYNGIIYGYEPEPWDSLIPRLSSMGQDVHIQGLEFAGGFNRRCHGYSSSLKDGETSALLTLAKLTQKGEEN
ncbi:MAG: phytoene desaturase family protein [Candidatus Hermodarchaeota archaeon]